MKFCQRCGKQIIDEAVICPYCGCPTQMQANAYYNMQQAPAKNRSIPGFVLGLIGAIFGLFGGICVSALTSFGGNDEAAMILMIGGSLVGLVGSCLCFGKPKIGAILELAGAVMIAICAFGITGSDIAALMGMFLLAVGGLVGLLTSSK